MSLGFCYGAEGPLAGLPSEPGTHIAKIVALKDNQWITLGQPAADPVHGRNWGRTWGHAQVAAPALRGGFFYGEGPHGMSSPNNPQLYGDDLWFYDINRNQWVNCYPGTDIQAFIRDVQGGKTRIDDDGILKDSTDQALAVATLIHAYSMLTFDPDSLRFAFLGEYIHYQSGTVFGTARTMIWAQTNANPVCAKAFSPYFFNTQTGNFERYAFGGESPQFGFADIFKYIPSLKKYIYIMSDSDVWLYDLKRREWTHPAVSGPVWQVGIEASACFDNKRNRVYVGGASYNSNTSAIDNFYYLDLNTMAWVKPNPTGFFPQIFNSSSALLDYDAANDRAVIINGTNVYAYNPDLNEWTSLVIPVAIANLMKGYNGRGGFYDPVLNAYFYHFASDGRTDGSMIVYRYKGTNSITENGGADDFSLLQVTAFPNPFNPALHVSFTLPEASGIHVAVYGADGRLVRTIASGGFGPGTHQLSWNAGDAAAGVYVVRLTAGNRVLTRKVVLAK